MGRSNAVLGLILAVFLVGCGTIQVLTLTGNGEDLILAFSKVTLADIDAAYADAVAHNDTLAIACYPTLRKYVGTLGGSGQAPIVGAVSAYQKARDARLTVDTGVPNDLRLACAAMVQDSKDFVLKMIAMSGAAVPK